MTERVIFDAESIRRSIGRIAHEIIERNHGDEPLAFVGIHTRGVPLARRLMEQVRSIDPERRILGAGELDVSFHRDDLERNLPVPRETNIPFSIDGACVILVDDVFYTGRTVRAAMNALADLGRPHRIRLAVLIDRGHRQLPIRADHVGKNVPTAYSDNVLCRLVETDGEDAFHLQIREAS